MPVLSATSGPGWQYQQSTIQPIRISCSHAKFRNLAILTDCSDCWGATYVRRLGGDASDPCKAMRHVFVSTRNWSTLR
jgi:hypothetical protein